MTICDSCVEAFIDEGLDVDTPIELFPLDMGADIPDHECDKFETGGEIKCDCGCTFTYNQ